MYPMDRSTRNNDLMTYEEVTDQVLLYRVALVQRSKSKFQNGPAMTWGMHAIGHLELGQEEEAAAMFAKSYLPYVQVSAKSLNFPSRFFPRHLFLLVCIVSMLLHLLMYIWYSNENCILCIFELHASESNVQWSRKWIQMF